MKIFQLKPISQPNPSFYHSNPYYFYITNSIPSLLAPPKCTSYRPVATHLQYNNHFPYIRKKEIEFNTSTKEFNDQIVKDINDNIETNL